MEIWTQFVSNNLLLIILWFVLLYMIINSYVKAIWDRSPQQVVQLLNQGNTLILDVREAQEYQSGHIPDSLHIPMSEVKKQLARLEKHKNGNIVVSCRSGQRSARICSLLRKQGFANVFNLQGGIIAWEGDKLPVSKK